MESGFNNDKYAPCPLVREMVEDGRLGKKSGEGFYNYSNGQNDLVVSTRFNKKLG
jgi:3-hydroxybutyryl-CoA dehydrogenase